MNSFRNRNTAGRKLAEALQDYRQHPQGLVLALPRGGVPVAYEVASALELPLDVLVVRKLGFPGQEELAMGAIASGGVQVINSEVLDMVDVSEETIDRVAAREREELRRREAAYRGQRPFPALKDRCVILVDDGLATGSTMKAAVSAVREQEPAKIVVAVPVAPEKTVVKLRQTADDVICLHTPVEFLGIGGFYDDFSQTTDEEVRDYLNR